MDSKRAKNVFLLPIILLRFPPKRQHVLFQLRKSRQQIGLNAYMDTLIYIYALLRIGPDISLPKPLTSHIPLNEGHGF